MDLPVYFRVLWRFRVLVLIGFLVAIALTFLSFVRISFDGGSPELEYRDPEVYAAGSTIFITQEGFALGRSVYDELLRIQNGDQTDYVPRLADPTRFSSYANLYARLATSDEMMARMLREGPLKGEITASATPLEGNSSIILPLVNIRAFAGSPRDAIETADRATTALREYIQDKQVAAGIKPDRRVILQVLNRPLEAQVVEARSLTRPIAIFVTVMFAFCALAFVLENARPRVRLVDAGRGSSIETRRSA